jgi:hypothetical protein
MDTCVNEIDGSSQSTVTTENPSSFHDGDFLTSSTGALERNGTA